MICFPIFSYDLKSSDTNPGIPPKLSVTPKHTQNSNIIFLLSATAFNYFLLSLYYYILQLFSEYFDLVQPRPLDLQKLLLVWLLLEGTTGHLCHLWGKKLPVFFITLHAQQHWELSSLRNYTKKTIDLLNTMQLFTLLGYALLVKRLSYEQSTTLS